LVSATTIATASPTWQARHVGGQQSVRPDEHRAAARAGQLHVELGRGDRRVRDRLDAIGDAVGTRQHREHARHCLCCGRLDADDARVRMRRAHHRGVGLAFDGKVVGEAALAGQQPGVLLAAERLADRAERRAGGELRLIVHGGLMGDFAPSCPRLSRPFTP
jgi:hypothetical protein